jgi:N6-L-threonylcarbamoyladenine synthase
MEQGFDLCIPAPSLCVDNGAMIAAAGYFRLRRGEQTPLDAAADPSLPLVGVASAG